VTRVLSTKVVVAVIWAVVALLGVRLLAGGPDLWGAVIFVFVVAFGALSAAIVGKAGSGRVTPATCSACGRLLSESSPYCKHCGARRDPGPDVP
jgi:hypothetical protein